jgi:D-glycerate 3-kinase
MGVEAKAVAALEHALPDGPGRARRIYELYLPIFAWLAQAVHAAVHRPLVAGISAPQGAGKSTLASHLVPLFADLGLRAVAVSIDDFYLSHEEQERLAAANPGNPYLEYRGYPGTHDVPLGAVTLAALRGLGRAGPPHSGSPPRGGEGDLVRVPVYDKSLRGGRGDRLLEERWRVVRGPLDLVLVEGWMLGFRPRDEAQIADPSLRAVNARLAAYESWLQAVDVLVILAASDPRQVLHWRVDAEEAMKASGKPGLARAAIEDYVRRFLPAYELYAGTVATGRWAPDRQLVFSLGEDRLPVQTP